MRPLGNGAREATQVATDAGGQLTGAWWADTWRLGTRQSEGDRSVLGTAMIEHTDEDASVVVTAAGSASEELWLRLCRLGYLAPVPTAELPEALRLLSQARAFAITTKGIDPSRLPALTAAWATTATTDTSPERAGEFAAALYGLPLPPTQTLEGLRRDLMCTGNRFLPREGSAALQFLGGDLLEQRGLLTRAEAGEWRPALLATLVAPFVLDAVVQEGR